jgi:hypothetical protein
MEFIDLDDASGRAGLTLFGASLQDWEETGIAAREVVAQRLAVLAKCDQAGCIELQRAAAEKVDFCLRWSWRLFTEGWLDLDGSMARMVGEMRSEVAANRDRLSPVASQE